MSCSAQGKFEVNDISAKSELNYVISNILPNQFHFQEIYQGGLFVKVFQIADSKATPEETFEEYDGVLSSFLISVSPDGDYYTTSKLYKIEGLLNPVIKTISEIDYPEFSVKIEYGSADNRKTKEFIFKGI